MDANGYIEALAIPQNQELKHNIITSYNNNIKLKVISYHKLNAEYHNKQNNNQSLVELFLQSSYVLWLISINPFIL